MKKKIDIERNKERNIEYIAVRKKERNCSDLMGKTKRGDWLGIGRETSNETRRNRDGERGVGRPCALSRAAPPGRPYIHPDFIYPPCIQRVHAFVCAVVKTHTTLT